jgi:hypothetical protein
MKIDVDIDTSELQERFKLTEKNIAYATVNAVNETAKQVQKLAQDNVRSKFHVRKDFVIRQAAIIKPFASIGQSRPYAEISVGQKPRLLLSDFEKGAQRPPFIGKRVAMPVPGSPARPTLDAQVPGNLLMTALNLQPALSAAQIKQRKTIKGSTAAQTKSMRADFTRAAGAGQVWKGKEHTYMIPGVGVFQRTGKGKRDTTLLYKFVPTQTLIPRLGFLSLAKGEGQRLFKKNMETAVIAELARKRK